MLIRGCDIGHFLEFTPGRRNLAHCGSDIGPQLTPSRACGSNVVECVCVCDLGTSRGMAWLAAAAAAALHAAADLAGVTDMSLKIAELQGFT